MSKEKDQTTAYELVRDYGGNDNAGLLRRKIEAALTAARQEERAAAFKDLTASVDAVESALLRLKKRLKAAANEPQANKVEPER